MPLAPEIQGLVDAMAASPDARPTHEQTPQDARAGYRLLGSMFGPGEDVASAVDRTLPGPAGAIPIRVYTPEGEGPFPILVFLHGGGWVIGDLDSHDKECRALCNRARCVVVAVDYRLAPEHPYPAAVDDAWAALRWVAEHAAELGGDARRLAVGGDSAGGNLSAVLALLARDAGGPELRFQLLVYPAVDLGPASWDRYPSRKENAAGPFLLRETMEYFMGHYLRGGPEQAEELRASPIRARSHAGLPPALILTAELDPLRDEGAAYGRVLEDAGVEARVIDYPGMPHAFFQLGPVTASARDAIDAAGEALRAAFV